MNRASRLPPRTLLTALASGATAALPLALSGALVTTGQQAGSLGYSPGRVFTLHQNSYWVSDGIDPRVVSVSDTTLRVTPETSEVDFRGDSLTFWFSPSGRREGAGVIGRDERGRFVRVEFRTPPKREVEYPSALDSLFPPELNDSLFPQPSEEDMRRWAALDSAAVIGSEKEAGSLFVQVGLWLSAFELESDSFADTVDYLHEFLTDTPLMGPPREGWAIHYRRTRTGTVEDSFVVNGERWLSIASDAHVTIQSQRTIEEMLDPTPVWRLGDLSGLVSEHFLYQPDTGQVDSVHVTGTLRGELIFREATGETTSVSGRWVLEQVGRWVDDPARAEQERFAYYVAHGRDSLPDQRWALPHETLVDRVLRGDTTALDSLFAQRKRVADPVERVAVDGAVARTRWGTVAGEEESAAVTRHRVRLAERDYAPGDLFLLDMAMGGGYANWGMSQKTAEILARLLSSLHNQRIAQLDREDFYAALLNWLGSRERLPDSKAAEKEAAPLLAEAARRTDDPQARDLLALAAYEADPARYLGLAKTLTDSIKGYGPIVRQYIEGNAAMMYWSWGLDPGQEIRGLRFPGPEAAWSTHSEYLENSGGTQALRYWFRARGLDPITSFRQRFASESDPDGRLVWTRYLLSFDDTIPKSWLISLAERGGALSEEAYRLLEGHSLADTVRDAAIIADLQNRLLSWLTMGTGLVDSAGKPAGDFRPHNERPEQAQMLSEGLMPEVVEQWSHMFDIVPEDSLAARRDREGLQMALVVSPIRRISKRFYLSIDLLPWIPAGEMCLCGGGTSFTVERRDGEWVVIDSGWWVS